MMKPVLSIGIIFKNEIRCLERCLKSLQPLRDAVPCELVMADTGATDGSREVAEKYADILFDFPWINDFAAARNAVMDRSSGAWFFSIDCDEWLDEKLDDLINLLRDPKKWKKYDMAGIIVRNYVSEDLETQYSDLLGVRLVRMDTKNRYEGAIHEHWSVNGTIYGMDRVILHHDGYVGLVGEKGRAKRERNMTLLRKELEKSPKDLLLLIQCIESDDDGPDTEDYINRAIAGVEEKWTGWEQLGPAVFRHSVRYARARNLPDLSERAARGREMFPDSPFITIDMTYLQFSDCIDKKKYAEAIPYGEAYLRAVAEYHKGGNISAVTLYSSLAMVSVMQGYMTRIVLADAYFQEKQYQKARDMLRTLNGGELNELCARNCTGAMVNLHAQSGLDLSEDMAKFWDQIIAPTPSEERSGERQRGVADVAVRIFSAAYRAEEDRQGFRHAYTLFLPLAGKCGWGDAAAILEEADPEKLTAMLGRVEKWKACPIEALAHALERGAVFPLPEKPLMLEEMDVLVNRLAQDKEGLLRLTQQLGRISDFQTLTWVRGLLLAAVRTYDWSDEEQGLSLARKFAAVERQFLTLCYAPEMLRPENLFALPAMHRFGWYCARAFEALDGGDPVGYVRRLRVGLSVCEGAKAMVEFLVDHTPEVQTAPPSQELLDLADKVRGMLSALAPDDPAVEALKQSPAYRKVSHLIEGPDLGPLLGMIPQ